MLVRMACHSRPSSMNYSTTKRSGDGTIRQPSGSKKKTVEALGWFDVIQHRIELSSGKVGWKVTRTMGQEFRHNGNFFFTPIPKMAMSRFWNDKSPILNGLVEGKIYRKPWFLPSSIGGSCKFSHHPILWHSHSLGFSLSMTYSPGKISSGPMWFAVRSPKNDLWRSIVIGSVWWKIYPKLL
jgi:flavin-binding protein dodecin